MGETTFIDNIINAILTPIMQGVEVIVRYYIRFANVDGDYLAYVNYLAWILYNEKRQAIC